MPRATEPRIVVSFASTFDAMEAERLCQQAGVAGRIIPLPVEIDAECGLAWAMPATEAALAAFNDAVAGHLVPEGIYRLML
ncbi:DUF3343 domain-containing protein [Collinsella tanakaei]|uniref:DUF3343 domain-containing protein n=1 Tax=Collinsella tanakaei TaxID=626935 RepID=UPI001956510A|nr:DUF3343 domain-containing protein [Collinsella tanakaei]MBM6755216.1 DUF3343 domain-containing protein [Collinsella tanakaei]MBM6868049.1 DUF3343 domain-containing protein [Collinsella tanakaei]